MINSLNPARVRIPVPQKLEQIFVYLNRMESSLSLQKFQEDDTQGWAINFQQRKELLFSRNIHSVVGNRLSLVSVEWGGLRRVRAHRGYKFGSWSLHKNYRFRSNFGPNPIKGSVPVCLSTCLHVNAIILKT
ncbi:hypothetical protein AVEN_164407-1 [Araneus ventricosus]|uniref:Uncharacterized protein n=1 Tax=Araneus ventricosus TaxID=182803 RepID=A0A4Y2GRH5_ARAVE|nr:hypothetical protein AVEN_164407-1 [Araneus ventricosus]